MPLLANGLWLVKQMYLIYRFRYKLAIIIIITIINK